MNQEYKLPSVATDIIWRMLDENAVVVSPREGEVRVLNAIGTAIWQLLIDSKDLADIEAYLGQQYEVPKDTARADLLAFLDDLVDRGILVRDETSS